MAGRARHSVRAVFIWSKLGAPQSANKLTNGAHGVTRPTFSLSLIGCTASHCNRLPYS